MVFLFKKVMVFERISYLCTPEKTLEIYNKQLILKTIIHYAELVRMQD